MTRPRRRLVTQLAATLACATLLVGCASRPSSVNAIVPPHLDDRDAFGAAIACEPTRHDVLLSWIARDSTGWRIWFARSADHGTTWSTPVAVSPADEQLLLDPESGPRLVCDDANHVGIAWSAGEAAAGSRAAASDLRFANSMDGGRSWNAPVTVNDNGPDPTGHASHHDVALSPSDGVLFAAWLDTRPGADSATADPADGDDASIWMARSQDFGTHWSANAAHWSRACPNCRVGLVVDPSKTLFVTFRKHYEGQIRDAVLARPYGALVRMHEDDWRNPMCPAVGPAMTLSRDGTLRIAWYTGAPGRTGVWFRQSVPEVMDSLATPVPVLASRSLPAAHVALGEAGMRGTLIACDADSMGTNQLTLARVEPSGRGVVERFIVPGTFGASHPSIASERAARFAYVAWTATAGPRRELRLARWDVGR